MLIFSWKQDAASETIDYCHVQGENCRATYICFFSPESKSYPRGSLAVFLLHLIGQDWLGKQDAGFYDWLRALDPSWAAFWSQAVTHSHPPAPLLARKKAIHRICYRHTIVAKILSPRYPLLTHKFVKIFLVWGTESFKIPCFQGGEGWGLLWLKKTDHVGVAQNSSCFKLTQLQKWMVLSFWRNAIK